MLVSSEKELPKIRSERPAFELHYPHMVDRMRDEAHFSLLHRSSTPPDEPAEEALASTHREGKHRTDDEPE